MRIFILIITSCLFFSCTPPTQFITRDYSGKRLQAESLSICLDRDRIIINNPDDVNDDLGQGAANDVFYRFFDSTATLAIPTVSTIKKAKTLAYPDRAQMKETAFTLGSKGGEINIKIPSDGTQSTFGQEASSYVLFIDLIQIHRDAGTPATMVPGPKGQMSMTPGRAAALEINFQYALWDPAASKTIAYGKSTARAPLLFAMTKGTWQTAMHEMMRLIMRHSPFDLPPVAGY